MPAVASKWCPGCKRQVAAISTGPNHVLHLLVSVLTAGLWIPLWFWFSLGAGYICPNCARSISSFRLLTWVLIGVFGLMMWVLFSAVKK